MKWGKKEGGKRGREESRKIINIADLSGASRADAVNLYARYPWTRKYITCFLNEP